MSLKMMAENPTLFDLSSYVTGAWVAYEDPLHKTESYVTPTPYQSLHKTLETLTHEELKDLRKLIDELLKGSLEDKDIPTPKNREIVRRERIGAVVYQLERVRCGKANCQKCPHGPYWYSYQRVNGRVKSKYLGKNFSLPQELI